jgi:hypothetical protein
VNEGTHVIRPRRIGRRELRHKWRTLPPEIDKSAWIKLFVVTQCPFIMSAYISIASMVGGNEMATAGPAVSVHSKTQRLVNVNADGYGTRE